MMSRAVTGSTKLDKVPPKASVVKPSKPQAIGRDLADGLNERREIFKADETTAQNAEDQHDNGTCIGNLCRCTGKGCDQHSPACCTEDRRKDQDDDPERVTPFDLKEKGRCENQNADLCNAHEEDAQYLAAQDLSGLCGGDHQPRQCAFSAFSKDGPPAVGDGIHQEHQGYAGRKIGKQVEFNRISAFCICFERDGRSISDLVYILEEIARFCSQRCADSTNPLCINPTMDVMPLVRPSSTREMNSSTMALTMPALVGLDGFVYTSICTGSGWT